MKLVRWLTFLAATIVLAGCAGPKPLYTWGSYEPLIYTMYAKPEKATPEFQVEKLEADFQKARAKNKAVPPGFHAHLGYMYYALGKFDAARQEFQTEKVNFPESAVFMDRLLANLEKQ